MGWLNRQNTRFFADSLIFLACDDIEVMVSQPAPLGLGLDLDFWLFPLTLHSVLILGVTLLLAIP